MTCQRSQTRHRPPQTDASAARELAAGADRDVSEVRAELRAHTRALNALRETQVEQGQAMDRGFAEMRVRLDQTTGGLDQILGLLNTRSPATTSRRSAVPAHAWVLVDEASTRKVAPR